MTVGEHFDQIVSWLQQNKLKFKGMQAEFQVVLTGDEGGHYWLKVNRGEFGWGEGILEKPGCTVTVNANDFKKLAAGEMSPALAFMQGKVKIQGDISLAMKFGSLLA